MLGFWVLPTKYSQVNNGISGLTNVVLLRGK